MLALLVTTSCPKKTSVEWKFYSPKSYRILIDDRLIKLGKLPQIIKATNNWENATNHIVSFDIVIISGTNDEMFIGLNQIRFTPNINIENSIYVLWIPSNLLIKEGYDVSSLTLATCTQQLNSYRIISVVSDQLTDAASENFDRLIMHELGHALGVAHVNPKLTAMMNPTLPFWPKCLNKIDMDAFCKAWNCSSDKMNYCTLEE